MSIHDNRAGRINCLLIAGGVWHDIDHARLELLKATGRRRALPGASI